MSSIRASILALLALLPLATAAQDDRELAAERQRIASERSRVDAEFLAAQKACYQRFAVTDCINAARAKRREVDADLRRQEIGLNDLERKQRTAERLRQLEEKETRQRVDQEERRAKAPDAQAAIDQRIAEKAQAASQAASAAKKPGPKSPGPVTPTVPDVAQNQQRYEQRLEEARKHRAQVEDRASRSTRKPQPLPVPQ